MPADPRPDRGRFALVATTGVAASVLLLVASSRTWASASTDAPAARTLEVSGSDVAPSTLALALVTLAAWGALLVLRRRARRLVALLGAAAAAAALVVTALRLDEAEEVAARELGADVVAATTTAWPFATLAAAVLGVACFAVATIRAARWPELGNRYDAPGATSPPDDLWRALDEGRDPTV